MILYDYWRSSSAWRVRIALNLKGIAYDRRVVNLAKDSGEQHAAGYRALNPLGQVPLLIDDDQGSHQPFTLTQSMAIIHYLDERFPAPPLLPATPALRARARQMAEIVNAGTQPMQNLALLDMVRAKGVDDPHAIAHEFNIRGLSALEAIATDTAGTFMLDEAPTIADVYLIPQLYAARRFGVDLDEFPTLTRVEASCAALPAFRAAHADAQSDSQKT
jgi:maleylpyruvate isomerase